MTITTLVGLLATSRKTNLSNDNGGWRQFVLDHLDYIAKNSGTFIVASEVMEMYKYDSERFVKERMQRNEDIAWIVLLLNDIPSNLDFCRAGDYLIPTDSFMKQLNLVYMTVTNNAT